MSNPSSYMSDGSYLKVSSSEGKKVYYPNGGNSHSGIYTNGTVTSKWGQAGLYQHSLSHCPYGTTGVSYYKFNPNIPPLLSEPQFK